MKNTMCKSDASKAGRTTRLVVDLKPKADESVRGGIVVTKVTDSPS